ncbi:hypothetical protein AXG93_2062s1280 [Marchantia polymorpha subsp. ruderalis]|uniref:Uncharacterized protein n=1 Tax=Marchantia polymorpha subsp. ruderalis TaxID=1480154 RepID=A0A176VEV2_MARPO|nr:hypothetical protein AXG93_2062s1280 [Marchantia polymorpha subsp. ruderalis]
MSQFSRSSSRSGCGDGTEGDDEDEPTVAASIHPSIPDIPVLRRKMRASFASHGRVDWRGFFVLKDQVAATVGCWRRATCSHTPGIYCTLQDRAGEGKARQGKAKAKARPGQVRPWDGDAQLAFSGLSLVAAGVVQLVHGSAEGLVADRESTAAAKPESESRRQSTEGRVGADLGLVPPRGVGVAEC